MAIIAVKGIDFYGYHSKYSTFLKVYLLNPSFVNKTVALLENGAILGENFKVFESHIPYTLQFLLDYNLYGMDTIDLSFCKFRMPILDKIQNQTVLISESSIPIEYKWAEIFDRASNCELEIDTWPSEIINRERVLERANQPLIHFTSSNDQIKNPLVPSLAAIWKDESDRRNLLGFDQYCVPLKDTQRQSYIPWSNEARLRIELGNVILESQNEPKKNSTDTSENFLKKLSTTFQAVSALHPQKYVSESFQNTQLDLGSFDLENTSVAIDTSLIEKATQQFSSIDATDLLDWMVDSCEDMIEAVESENEIDLIDWDMNVNDLEYIESSLTKGTQNSILDLVKSENVFETEIPIDEDNDRSPEKFDLDYRELINSLQPVAISPSLPALVDEPPLLEGEDLYINRLATVDNNVDCNLHDIFQDSPAIALPYLSVDEESFGTDSSPPTPILIDGELEYFVEKILQHKILFGKHLDVLYLVKWDRYPVEEASWLEYNAVKDTEAYEHYVLSHPDLLSIGNDNNHEINVDPIELIPQNDGSDEKRNAKIHNRRGKTLQKIKELKIDTDFENFTTAKTDAALSWPASLSLSLSQLWSPDQSPTKIWSFYNDPPEATTPSIDRVKSQNNDSQENSLSQIDCLRTMQMIGAENYVWRFKSTPPQIKIFQNSSMTHHIALGLYQEPFYSNIADVPSKPMRYAGREFNVKSNNVDSLPTFDFNMLVVDNLHQNDCPQIRSHYFTPALPPPTLSEMGLVEFPVLPVFSQINIPTLKVKHGFKFSQSQAKANTSKNDLCLLSVELHVNTPKLMLPDPRRDSICAIFYCFQYTASNYKKAGLIIVDDGLVSGMKGYDYIIASNEESLFQTLIDLIISHDPDILLGYEIQNLSWGYLNERALIFRLNFTELISRIKETGVLRDDTWGAVKQSQLVSPGRIFFNIWRLMRSTLNLTSYTQENVVFHIIHQRIPKFSQNLLCEWYKHGRLRWRCLGYYLDRVDYNLELLDRTELINQTRLLILISEFAKVYGVEFYSVIIRGSQYKVESVMARIARPENLVMYSPSRENVQRMNAPESLPLNMEPRSQLYTSPVLVLDFQSLYPSLMIAYNYCYSTVLGRIAGLGSQKLGCRDLYEISHEELVRLQDHVNIAPNGVVFVKPHIRQGVLSRMVSEILDTRIMVKNSMKLYEGDRNLTRILEAKQIGLKLLANVTFGYTAASFSGRMPCVDISDSIIQTGRSTLERSIESIHANPSWKATVVYGDTDSLFVSIEGRTKDEAFDIGRDMVALITSMNPSPIKLKFEKVYLPCVLIAKKRYVGFKFESPHDIEPVFDAKGIETVRRDGCPAVSKLMESCLKLLFRTMDLSLIKSFLYEEWSKILNGNVSIQDFLIAKEVKLGTYNAKTLPAGAHLSVKKMEKDARAEPQYGERVPFVVVHRGSNHRLIDAVVQPIELIYDQTLRLNGTYYILKQIIAPLARVFNLIGVDIAKWYQDMPKKFRATQYVDSKVGDQKTIDYFYKSSHCTICHTLCQKKICIECSANVPLSIAQLGVRVHIAEKKYKTIQEICRSCTGYSTASDADILCESLDCPIFYTKIKAKRKASLSSELTQLMNGLQGQEDLERTEKMTQMFY